MSIIVEPTVSYSSSVLDIENPHRWNKLFPLLRPSVVAARAAEGQTILVDQAHALKKDVHIAVIGKLGNFSSKLLDNKNVTAIVTEQEAGVVTCKDIQNTLGQSGVNVSHGLVVLRSGHQQRVQSHGSHLLEVETRDELELNHLLCLIGSVTASCRQSSQAIKTLVELFQENVSTTRSIFGADKIGDSPSITHVYGARAFDQAKHTIEKDLKQVLSSQTQQQASTVYSVHYSDINGLSRLETYIIAAELGRLVEAQGLSYSVSQSSIVDHVERARGYRISICAIPSQYLHAQPKADLHRRSAHASGHAKSQAIPALMSFSDAQARGLIRAGCEAVIKAEPIITEYDTIVGDGDCGYTLRDGAKQVLHFIEDQDLAQLPDVLSDLVHALEVNMGGTSGALYCIYLTALAASVRTEPTVAEALQSALQELLKYTKARVGDRTMMDTLIPFTETLAASGDVKEALVQARAGVESTKTMQAQLGRSSYLDESTTQGVPDPGAYGLLVLLEGMSSFDH